jgi:hypothetical protein
MHVKVMFGLICYQTSKSVTQPVEATRISFGFSRTAAPVNPRTTAADQNKSLKNVEVDSSSFGAFPLST